ncbi:MAG: hypothetical protein FWC13_09315 [Oscillospiraceae bacterium]|nr:hypothetical protein [Oscillospiraceae bacterium]
MPLVNCPQCGFEFPPEDLVCPNCGYLYDIDEELPELPLEEPQDEQELPPPAPDYEDEEEDEESENDSAETVKFSDEDSISDESIQRGCLIGVGVLCALVLVIMMIVTFVLGSNRTG